ncbi:uncharacterized protein LOC110879682 [Helianthus annuus]|uniref:uncharacterized protein LOC110879682 n=1 Tax=Helianthus annuus TaxID=4232 RepID=UPI000B9066C0|nr:uncharacterized protein LOC110879682 [Helianthus annuus]
MPKSDDSPSQPDKPAVTPLHPAYTVTNVQSKIRTLDGTKVTYSQWVKLFTFHAIAYKVLDHIDDTQKPTKTDPDYETWKEIDALVSQWIYSTISDDLLGTVLDTTASARTTWLQLQKKFLGNKQAKAAALETRFVNLTLASCASVDDYCQQLKELANQLSDVDQPVTESRMVLQLVRGLSAEFDTTAQLIHSQQADWDTARTMLNDEVIRLEARKQQSSSVLYTPASTNHTTNQQTPAHSSENNQQQQQPPSYRGRGRGRGQGYRGRGGRGRGNRGQSPPTPWNFLNYTGQQQQFPQWAWWSTPPCPYPTQNTWKPNPTPQHPSANFAGQPHPAPPPYGHSPSGFDALSPSDLSAAFQTMQLQYQDPNAVMDTGAEQHATENRGSHNGASAFPPQ